MQPWRWLPPITATGATQMAIDRWMLAQLLAGGGPVLRLYRWSRPTLSLGRHQRRLEPHWPALVAAGVIDLVRRPSGGRAVLHCGELTYALACRPAGTGRLAAYRQACGWLQAAFADLGQPLVFGGAQAAQAHGRSSCFASGTAADLVHAGGAKRIGSAQLWSGPALLQHGSLLLAPDAALWRRVFAEPPPELAPLPLAAPAGAGPGAGQGDLEERLRRAAERHLCGGPLREQALSAAEWQAIAALECVQDSPLACIERATDASAIPSG